MLEVICGPTRSGKTTAIISRVRRAILVGEVVQVFVPPNGEILWKRRLVTHDGVQADFPAVQVADSLELLSLIGETTTFITVDDAQAFDADLRRTCSMLASGGVTVIVAGQDTDYCGNPVGHLADLAALSDQLVKLRAICTRCRSASACRTQAIISGCQAFQQFSHAPKKGGCLRLEPRCRKCFEALSFQYTTGDKWREVQHVPGRVHKV